MTVHLRCRFQQALMWGSLGLILPVLTLLLAHEGFSLFEIGLFAALFSLSTVILELLFGALADRLGGIRAYRWSLLTNCAGCGIMLMGEQKPSLFLAAGFRNAQGKSSCSIHTLSSSFPSRSQSSTMSSASGRASCMYPLPEYHLDVAPARICQRELIQQMHQQGAGRAVVAKSFVEGASVSRLAREFNINANQVFTWRRQFADLQGTSNEGPAAALLPITVLESAVTADERILPTSGVIVLTVGSAQLRLEGSIDGATLAQVLARLLP